MAQTLPVGTDLNTLWPRRGLRFVIRNPVNAPTGATPSLWFVENMLDRPGAAIEAVLQRATHVQTNRMYTRIYESGVWGTWKLVGTDAALELGGGGGTPTWTTQEW